MSSSKIDYSRRQRMLKLAAEAPAILASETDRLENSFWPSRTVFLQDYPAFSNDGRPWKDDDQNMDVMALVVVDKFPAETLNEIIRANTEETSEPYLWLADTYDSLPDWSPSRPAQGTSDTVDKNWCSPFISSSVQDIVAFIEAAPKPSKPLCKRFFAVLEKQRYEQDQQLLIYRISENPSGSESDSKLQCVPCPIHFAGLFFASYDRSDWQTAVDEQAFYHGEGAAWEDDDPYTQVMALFVLDDLPTETINRVLDDNSEEADEAYLWLADTYASLPDYRPNCRISGTYTPISDKWKSPFVSKTIADAANFIRNAPKPPKPLCKRFFAILQKDRLEKSGQLLICKILPDGNGEEADTTEAVGNEGFRKAGRSLICKAVGNEGDIDEASEFEVQIAEMESNQAGTFFSVYERHSWSELGLCDEDWVV